MAHWFHRNPIKPSEFAKFELKGVITKDVCSKICSELRMRREKLLPFFKSAANDYNEVTKEFDEYMALFQGFMTDVTDDSKESKIAPLLRMKWGHTMLVGVGTEYSNAWFEALNLVVNMAVWLTKHAAWLAGKDEVNEKDAKLVHTCFKRASSMYGYVLDNLHHVSGIENFEGCDLDAKVLRAYQHQSTAESQEIVVARAIEMKHQPLIVSSLSTHTANMFSGAERELANLNKDIFGRWRIYLQLKHHLYLSYAYAFLGESLLAEDKCGEAVRACQEGVSEFNIAEELAVKYAKADGPGTRIKPEQHMFFRKVKPLLERHLEKAKRENGFIYHQKVPDQCPSLDDESAYGITKIESYTLPAINKMWTPDVYAAFDLSKAEMPDFSKIQKSKKKIDPVEEEKIYQTEKDPSNSSGCSVM
ncbi:unnamed protein product [Auanema sp. JU1783]|nr:unnamed protein product [Auanema sp. JU1783]